MSFISHTGDKARQKHTSPNVFIPKLHRIERLVILLQFILVFNKNLSHSI